MTDPRDLLRRTRFHRPQPSPLAGVDDMLTIGFHHDDTIGFGAGTDNPVRLAARLRDLFAALVEHDAIVQEASGIHGAAYHLIGEPLVYLDDEDAREGGGSPN
jgi:hypothetical protein